ncbi:Dysferlin protein [Phytophthora cinnamomi]|uniref:Dysferlin protein n=1 Tax=Phytophthora cinnamomi TaxID=4785 RepID=UPI00355A4F4C|nr:Dysferlin protein [Phytophthora cinnamomi]
MFSSGNRGGGFGGFAAQGGNPFAQSQGSTAVNPFQSGVNASAAKTAFGQSSGFGSQPPLPPGGLAGAPGGGFGKQPPLPPGGLTGAPPAPSGGFGAASTSGNPFGQKKTGKNNAQGTSTTAFGGAPFGQNGISHSANAAGAHTTFGSASAGGAKNRGNAFVCQEHQLKISSRPGGGDDSAILVKFGGDFETDVQLRRNNTPLKIRSSKIYVGMKQGNYLRRDICRGVTEYARDEYPALSKLIQDSEREERARLYPDRPEYEDDYSYFVDYNEGVPMAPPSSAPPTPGSASAAFGNAQQLGDINQKRQDLDMIAQRKMELEQKKQAMIQRMRELEQAKEAKVRQDQAKKAAAEEAAQREEQAKNEAIVRAQAVKEAAEAKRQQEELEAKLREQKKQRELEEQRRRVEEAAREAERQRLAALQQAEALRLKAAEEERRRQEEKRQEELRRKVAEELERRRQQELAEARARQAREAALEAQRQAQLAKEREERKRVRRIEKQRHAVLKLRLHMWKMYVQVSRNGPGPITIDARKLRLDRPHQKAKDSVQWLFRGADGTIGTPIGTRRLKQVPSTVADFPSSDAEVLSLWSSEDILELSAGLKELLEGSVKAMMNQYESSIGVHSNICAVFPRVREDVLSSGVMDLTYPPPELQFAVMDPPQGWNSQERRHEIRTVLTALEVTRIEAEASAVQRDQTCDVYFRKVEDFIDRLFLSYPASTAVSTYELKKRIYSALLPIHERLTQDGVTEMVTPQEADALLPWRKIFEEIYETFFETLSDINIYYPASWRGFGSSVARLLDAAHASVPRQLLVADHCSSKRDRAIVKQPVQVSMQSVRRTFGSLSTVDESLQEYRAVGEMKRLRVEIEKERAATSQFQRMLRQELSRWDD